ncbi:hypothetical protein CONLIGDRAFT_643579 [Coniochaeta ligniaria NRRL 30616]|uniref:Mediator of RNA polymerase II transcription subunit 11 n=1 Tax=Coniochaeta ligniaria NRRL 30616 TaxID=1408157 RepID=A0A1J7JI87_9PEZI|nr:hypothetical protein CONLIGDRAFT_643579 [Coniochaeta ligniaria NRRL 30616]
MEDDNQSPVDIHAPFTKQELIQQLAEIDNDITLLLSHTGTAIQSLAQPITSPSSTSPDGSSPAAAAADNTIANLNPEERLATFKNSMNAFMATLHSVDVRLKRQIWGLEEAGIVTLKRASREGADGASGGGGNAVVGSGGGGSGAAAVKTNLEPDGVGKIGGLDVGWLNARSSKVERDMEAELWTGMRKHLEGVVEGRLLAGGELFGSGEGGAAGEVEGEVGDVSMEG